MDSTKFAETICKAVYLQSIKSGKTIDQANQNVSVMASVASNYFQASWNYELAPTKRNELKLRSNRINFLKLCKKFKINVA
jgi:hypothetical protein